MRAPTVIDEPPAVILEDELRRLFRACEGTSFEDRRDMAIVSLFLDTGIRLGEMAGLDRTDFTAREIRVNGKTGPRIVPFEAITRRHLDRYLRERAKHPDDLFPAMWLGRKGPLQERGISQMIRRRARQAGIRLQPHQLRHTWATILTSDHDGERGAHEVDLQRLGGWKSLEMVTKYGRASANQRARNNYPRHSPVNRLCRR